MGWGYCFVSSFWGAGVCVLTVDIYYTVCYQYTLRSADVAQRTPGGDTLPQHVPTCPPSREADALGWSSSRFQVSTHSAATKYLVHRVGQ